MNNKMNFVKYGIKGGMLTSLKYPTFGNLQSWAELHKKYRNSGNKIK